ncbi:hypothetical protein N9J72_00355 [Candidatus Gracilibacteria bacterium]|nr:hypothetical protein [Candidatus Gracilibacteria bacterium]
MVNIARIIGNDNAKEGSKASSLVKVFCAGAVAVLGVTSNPTESSAQSTSQCPYMQADPYALDKIWIQNKLDKEREACLDKTDPKRILSKKFGITISNGGSIVWNNRNLRFLDDRIFYPYGEINGVIDDPSVSKNIIVTFGNGGFVEFTLENMRVVNFSLGDIQGGFSN